MTAIKQHFHYYFCLPSSSLCLFQFFQDLYNIPKFFTDLCYFHKYFRLSVVRIQDEALWRSISAYPRRLLGEFAHISLPKDCSQLGLSGCPIQPICVKESSFGFRIHQQLSSSTQCQQYWRQSSGGEICGQICSGTKAYRSLFEPLVSEGQASKPVIPSKKSFAKFESSTSSVKSAPSHWCPVDKWDAKWCSQASFSVSSCQIKYLQQWSDEEHFPGR